MLVHGIGSHWQAFEPVLDRLARERVTGAKRFVQLRRAGHVPFRDDPDGVVGAVLGA